MSDAAVGCEHTWSSPLKGAPPCVCTKCGTPKVTTLPPGGGAGNMTDFELMTPDEEGWSDWVHPLPGYLMKCCDCGLVHEMEFAIGERTGDGPLNEGETEDAVIIFRAKRAE